MVCGPLFGQKSTAQNTYLTNFKLHFTCTDIISVELFLSILFISLKNMIFF